MSKITYIKGDATNPQGKGNKIICHICNDIGAWGAGFVLALSDKWKEPEEDYLSLFNSALVKYPKHRQLGTVRLVPVEVDKKGFVISVANMIGQSGVNTSRRYTPPVRYPAVRDALKEVDEYARALKATLHMPRIGCGLGGGKWSEIEKIIKDVVTVDVTVYDL